MKNFIQLFYQDFLLKFAPMGKCPARTFEIVKELEYNLGTTTEKEAG